MRAVRCQMGIVSAVYSQSEILQKEARLAAALRAPFTRFLRCAMEERCLRALCGPMRCARCSWLSDWTRLLASQ